MPELPEVEVVRRGLHTHLLDRRLFRRDQIWFVEKNQRVKKPGLWSWSS